MNALHIYIIRNVHFLSVYYGNRMNEYNYTMPMAFLTAIALLVWCATVRVQGTCLKKLLKLYAPTAFGVYLIHTNPAFLDRMWIGSFCWLGQLPIILCLIVILTLPTVLFVLFGTVDMVRAKIFACISKGMKRK